MSLCFAPASGCQISPIGSFLAPSLHILRGSVRRFPFAVAIPSSPCISLISLQTIDRRTSYCLSLSSLPTPSYFLPCSLTHTRLYLLLMLLITIPMDIFRLSNSICLSRDAQTDRTDCRMFSLELVSGYSMRKIGEDGRVLAILDVKSTLWARRRRR